MDDQDNLEFDDEVESKNIGDRRLGMSACIMDDYDPIYTNMRIDSVREGGKTTDLDARDWKSFPALHESLHN